MRFKLSILGLFLFSGFGWRAWTHPVSFQDSVGVMGKHSPILVHNQLNYSYNHRLAVGVHHFTRPNVENQSGTFGSINVLLKRWYGEASQGNLYAILGGGQSELNGDPKAQVLTGVQYDIEDRKYYFLIKHLQVHDSHGAELRQTNMRVGFAPYVGDFEDLHTWFVVDFSQNQFADGFLLDDTTPMLRFFYENVLFELGQSFNGFSKFNYIVHF